MHLLEQDFDQLAPGQAFVTHGRTITEADVVAFATLTGDLHPQHVDAVWAAESPFGRRIAHGMLVLSYALGLVPLDPERVVALRRVRDVVFKRAVALGDTIHVEGEVERLTPLDETTGLVGCVWHIKNQRGRLVVRATVEVLWRRGAAPTAAASLSNGRAALEALPATL
jgi:3-hydroxybutyryl-CoA dehydratase